MPEPPGSSDDALLVDNPSTVAGIPDSPLFDEDRGRARAARETHSPLRVPSRDTDLPPGFVSLETIRRRDPVTGQETRVERVLADTPVIACSRCGGPVRPYGRTEPTRPYHDRPRGKVWCGVIIQRKRWCCLRCATVTTSPTFGLATGHRVTLRLVDFIVECALHPRVSYRDIHSRTGLEDDVVSVIVLEELRAREESTPIVAPRWLGIDETYARRGANPFGVFVDLEQRRILEIVEGTRDGEVALALRQMRGLDRTEAICTDFHWPYRTAIAVATIYLPHPPRHVIDHFHISGLARRAADAVWKRRIPRGPGRGAWKKVRKLYHRGRIDLAHPPPMLKELEVDFLELLAKDGTLRDAYVTRQLFRWILSAATRDEAERRYAEWVARIPRTVADEFEVVVDQIGKWHEEVMAYFDVRVTNGFTEAIHKRIKSLCTIAPNLEFSVMRARALAMPLLGAQTNLREAFDRGVPIDDATP